MWQDVTALILILTLSTNRYDLDIRSISRGVEHCLIIRMCAKQHCLSLIPFINKGSWRRNRAYCVYVLSPAPRRLLSLHHTHPINPHELAALSAFPDQDRMNLKSSEWILKI